MIDRFAPPPPDNDNDTADAMSAAVMLGGDATATLSLRLDADRHLRLRIACALRRCSAQDVMREALDAHLQADPDVDRRAVEARESGAAAFLWGMER